MKPIYRIRRGLARAEVLKWIGERRRPFGERREVVERKRGATWQVGIAVIAATVGATGLGYLAVQLFFLPETVAMSRLGRVPDLTGLDLDDAGKAGQASGYEVVSSGRQYSDDHNEGEVIYQIPPPDAYHAQGDTLWVLVSLGEPEPVVPDLSGVEPATALRILRQMGVPATSARRAPSDIHPQGTVIETVPPAGTAIDEDTRVTLILSRGGTFLEMPDVKGLTLAAARDSLELYSLTVGEVAGIEGDVEAGEGSVVVIEQEPGPARRIRSGSAVRLRLGEAPRAPRPSDVEPPPQREPLPPPDGEDADAGPEEGPPDAGREEGPADADEVPAEEVPVPDPAPAGAPPGGRR
ncbi:MAG TPA: PASTA domain-containing protein [Gemmatimonadota bacterium]|nr:PASTA domain-containing protein [Gemmatimonadota bacterium]